MFLGLNSRSAALSGIGFVITAAASALGIVWRSNHFYEFTLIGLAMMLIPFTPKEVWERRRLIKMYLLFVIAALVIDLVFGIIATRSWHYTYTTLFEYIVLYLWIYPLGGLVMVQSYLGARRLGTEPQGRNLRKSIFVGISIFFIVATIAAAALWWYEDSQTARSAFFVLATLVLCAGASLRCELRGKRSYVRDVLSSFPLTLGATLLATFGNFLIHEYPNIYAQEWIYAPGTLLLGVPLFIWCTWPLLTVGPISLFYMTDRGDPKP